MQPEIEYAESGCRIPMHELDSRHGYAMLLMVIGSVAISFGGLVQRNLEVAAPWQINLYRSLGLIAAFAAILELLDKPRPRQTPGQPGQTPPRIGVTITSNDRSVAPRSLDPERMRHTVPGTPSGGVRTARKKR